MRYHNDSLCGSTTKMDEFFCHNIHRGHLMQVRLQKIRGLVAVLRATNATRALQPDRSTGSFALMGKFLAEGIVSLELPRITFFMRGHDMQFEIENAEMFLEQPKIKGAYEQDLGIRKDKFMIPRSPGSGSCMIVFTIEEVNTAFRVASSLPFDEPLAVDNLRAFVAAYQLASEESPRVRQRRAS